MADTLSAQVPSVPTYHLSEKDHIRFLSNFSQPRETISVPPGFPSTITSSLVWKPEQAHVLQDDWTFHLSCSDVDSIKAALKQVKEESIPLQKLTPQNFCLSPELSARLKDLADSLYMGIGFGLIRGLNPSDFTMEESIIIYVGITSYFGDQRSYTGPTGTDVLAHIRDLGDVFAKDRIKSPAYTNSEMTFHTDLGDVVSLFTLERGEGGGSFRIASSGQIYNVLAKNHPEVLQTLSEDFQFDPLDNTIASYQMPLLHYHEDRIILQSFRRPFTGFGAFKRSEDLPVVSDAQIEALSTLHFTAREQSIKVDFQNGDIMVFNNLALLHARDKFDEPNPSRGKVRHLLKMFQRDSQRAWEIPPSMRKQWNELFEHRGEHEREETFPSMYPTRLQQGQVPSSGWSQNG